MPGEAPQSAEMHDSSDTQESLRRQLIFGSITFHIASREAVITDDIAAPIGKAIIYRRLSVD